MQAAIRAIKEYPNNDDLIFVATEVPVYSTTLIHFLHDGELIQVNESVLRHALTQLPYVQTNTRMFTGYGTGGAVAILIALLMNKHYVVTFGAPPVGNEVFNSLVKRKMNVTRVKLACDPVSTRCIGMKHTSDAIIVGDIYPSCMTIVYNRVAASMGYYEGTITKDMYINALNMDDFELVSL